MASYSGTTNYPQSGGMGAGTGPAGGKLNFDQTSTPMTVFYVLSSIFLPPLAVGVKTGDACETIINILFLFLGWIPAAIHAFLISFGSGSAFRLSCFPESAMVPPPALRMEQALASKGYGGTTGTGMGSSTSATTSTSRYNYPQTSGQSTTAYQTVPQKAY